MFRTIANLYHKFWNWSHTEIGDGIICFIIMLMAMLAGVDDKTIATIRISCLDTPTRELVESLLKAQEEEK